MTVPRILVIAGSDSGGGAGIQADIKTITMLGGHAMTAITAVTAQNTMGVTAVQAMPARMVVAQIDAVVEDIGVDAVKIGMIGSADTVHALADRLETLSDVPVVFDPVMVATSGSTLADAETIRAFERLLRLARVVTPNAPELAVLSGLACDDPALIATAGTLLAQRHGCAVLGKGGHVEGSVITDQLIMPDGRITRWNDSRIETRATHGTGCTLASAVAVGLGAGKLLVEASEAARAFVRAAMVAAPGLGRGHGPMGHGFVRPGPQGQSA